jgi:WD40 repeat protein
MYFIFGQEDPRLDVMTGEQISVLEVHEGGSSLAICPSGEHFAIAFNESYRAIGMWRTALDDRTSPRGLDQACITGSPPCRDGFSSCRHSDAALVTEDVVPLQGNSDFISCIVFSQDRKFITTGSHDHTVCVWNAETGAQALVLCGHRDIVDCVAFSPDGSWIASGSSDCTVRSWNATAGGQLMLTLQGHQKYVVSVAFSSHGERVVSACWGDMIYVWNASSGEKILSTEFGTRFPRPC